MTQAFNLSQLANNLNSSGQLDATDGLVNAVPVANGGTGASNASGARTNLDVPQTNGTGATGTWPINGFESTNFSVYESGGKLIFKYGATTIASLDSSGNFTSLAKVNAYGTQ